MAENLPRQGRTRIWGRELGWWLSGQLLGPAHRFGAAIIVAAGPWLVAVVALALISVTMTPAMGLPAVEDLRLTVVYAFCIAPIVAGPIGAVAARRISAEIDANAYARIPELFIAASVLSGLVVLIIALAVCFILRIGPIEVATGFIFLTVAAALLWTSFAVLAAVNAYGFLIAAFSGGMAFAVVCTLIAASRAPTTEVLIWCFSAGVLFCVAFCLRHIRHHFPSNLGNFLSTGHDLIRNLRDNAVLCAGVFFAICGVWIDKWIFWFGSDGVRSEAGFLHYSPYDSVMFLAHLSIIPSYAALLIFHHGDLVTAIGRFRAAIEARATYGAIRSSIGDLGRIAWSGLFTIAFVQGAVTLGLVLMAPLMMKSLDFNFNQFLLLRVGLIGVFLHSIMFLCCAILLVANCNRHFMLVQGGFLALNLTTSLLFYAFIGISSYAFFVSSLISVSASFYFAYRALQSYDYLIFLAENDSLYQR